MEITNKINPFKTLNEVGSHSIHILQKDQTLDDLDLEYRNIIHAKNGIFIIKKNEIFTLCNKIELNYSNLDLEELYQPELEINIIPPDISILEEFIEMSIYINSHIGCELAANIYYNSSNCSYELDVMSQKIGNCVVDYDFKESKFEFDSSYKKYLHIHSHNTMSANFSATDDIHDSNDANFKLYGVIGKLNNVSDIYSTDMKFRIYDGIKFIELTTRDVFNVEDIPSIDKHIPILDKLINEYNKNKNLTFTNTYKENKQMCNTFMDPARYITDEIGYNDSWFQQIK